MQPRQNDEVPFSGVWAGKFPLLARTRQDRAEGLCGGGRARWHYGKYLFYFGGDYFD
jgi:hypothetical protein